VLKAKSDTVDDVVGLESGADDFGVASRILRRHARLDQALVLAGRFLGSPRR
jgi:hypothetical protein